MWWFTRRAEAKRVAEQHKRDANDWVMVCQFEEEWHYKQHNKNHSYRMIVNMYENLLGDRKFDLQSTCTRNLESGTLLRDFSNQSSTYMKIINPWLKGTRFAKIPSYQEAKDIVYEERIVDKLTSDKSETL